MENQKFNPVGWFEIYVDDMERASKFYESVFNVQLTNMVDPTSEDGSNLMMRSFPGDVVYAGSTGALVKMEGMKCGGNSVIVYFNCEDCAIEENKAATFGGKVFQPKMSIGQYGFISLVTDTEGNIIGLYSMK